MPLHRTGRDAIMPGMNPSNRAALVVALVALLVLSLAGASLWLTASRPSDGARLAPGSQASWKPDGVVVMPLQEGGSGLRAGDIVTAVDGQPLESFARALFDPTAPRPAWQVGQVVQHMILRDGQALVVPVTLAPYPLGAMLLHEWGT